MILSVSRRTDIPAFYAEWFLRRVGEGHVMVRNPVNKRMVSRIPLDPGLVDWIVFWTKDPRPLVERLDRVRERYGEKFHFQYTLTPYDSTLEPSVPPLERRIDALQKLSDLLGPDRVVWRYDPVVFSSAMDLDFHRRRFEELAERIAPHTRRCVASLLDLYGKTGRNLAGLDVRPPSTGEGRQILSHMAQVLARWDVAVETCSEAEDFGGCGVGRGKCVDDRLISRLLGVPWSAAKDKGQRPECGCVPSIDIGAYDTCPHGCRYCYANSGDASVRRSRATYDVDSPLLCGRVEPGDQVKDRTVRRLIGDPSTLPAGLETDRPSLFTDDLRRD